MPQDDIKKCQETIAELRQKQGLVPQEDRSVIDWGVGALRAKLEELELAQSGFDREWVEMISELRQCRGRVPQSGFDHEWAAMERKWSDPKAVAHQLGWLDLDMDKWESPDHIYRSACDQVQDVVKLAVQENCIRTEFSVIIRSVRLAIVSALKHNQAEEKYTVMFNAMIGWLSEYPQTGEFAGYYQQAILALQS